MNLIKIFLPTVLAFAIGLGITPLLANYFYKHQLWKKQSRSLQVSSDQFRKIHNEAGELSTPRVGGAVIWLSVFLTTMLLFLLALLFPSPLFIKLSFLSRNQTLIPLASLMAAAGIGLVDDLLQIYGRGTYAEDHISYRRVKIVVVIIIGLLIGWWFFSALGVTSVRLPFDGRLELGWLFIPFFVFVLLGVFSSSVIDGIDGLAGGVMASVFAAYTTVAFFNNQIDLAAFSAALTGAILVFLWFNTPPARFYMGETGMLALTVTLTVVAFLTDSPLFLPIIALPLFATSLSVIIQLLSKKLRHGQKVFLVAPLHHHFEARGWSSAKVVMRYWIISVIAAVIGLITVLISR